MPSPAIVEPFVPRVPLPDIRPRLITIRDLPQALPDVRLVPQRDRRDLMGRAMLEQRVRAEFQEMPGLRLTVGQAVRLFGTREDICTRILDGLVDDAILARSGGVCYAVARR